MRSLLPDVPNLQLGLIGYPLQHSLSPYLHKYLLRESHQKGSYKTFETGRNGLSEKIKELNSSGFTGFNVTIPHKQTIIPHLDRVSDEVQRIGAANTVLIDHDRLHGFNTDYSGFSLALQNRKISRMVRI